MKLLPLICVIGFVCASAPADLCLPSATGPADGGAVTITGDCVATNGYPSASAAVERRPSATIRVTWRDYLASHALRNENAAAGSFGDTLQPFSLRLPIASSAVTPPITWLASSIRSFRFDEQPSPGPDWNPIAPPPSWDRHNAGNRDEWSETIPHAPAPDATLLGVLGLGGIAWFGRHSRR